MHFFLKQNSFSLTTNTELEVKAEEQARHWAALLWLYDLLEKQHGTLTASVITIPTVKSGKKICWWWWWQRKQFPTDLYSLNPHCHREEEPEKRSMRQQVISTLGQAVTWLFQRRQRPWKQTSPGSRADVAVGDISTPLRSALSASTLSKVKCTLWRFPSSGITLQNSKEVGVGSCQRQAHFVSAAGILRNHPGSTLQFKCPWSL